MSTMTEREKEILAYAIKQWLAFAAWKRRATDGGAR